MRRLASLLVLLASTAAAEDPGQSTVGSGLITLPSTETLAPHHVLVGIATDNADRDPLGLDLLDYKVNFTAGLGPRLEVYGHAVLSRVVAMPEPPALPPPPLDILVPRGASAPARPLYTLYFPIPYVNKRGTARFDDFVPGDLVLGGKWRLLDADGGRPALAASLELKVPLTRTLSSLQSGAGTGAVDGTARVTTERSWGRTSLVGSLAYTLVGAPPFDDRVIEPGGGTSELALQLPDRLDVGLGVRHLLTSRLALVGELVTVLDVGSRTLTVDRAWPIDGLAGVQWRAGGARLTVGARYHGHDLPSMAIRTSPIGGLVDLTDVTAPDLAAFLRSVGAGGEQERLRPGSQRLLATPADGVALPPGARRIPATYRIRSEHQIGFVVAFGWAF
jgi:hypothetical protein